MGNKQSYQYYEAGGSLVADMMNRFFEPYFLHYVYMHRILPHLAWQREHMPKMLPYKEG